MARAACTWCSCRPPSKHGRNGHPGEQPVIAWSPTPRSKAASRPQLRRRGDRPRSRGATRLAVELARAQFKPSRSWCRTSAVVPSSRLRPGFVSPMGFQHVHRITGAHPELGGVRGRRAVDGGPATGAAGGARRRGHRRRASLHQSVDRVGELLGFHAGWRRHRQRDGRPGPPHRGLLHRVASGRPASPSTWRWRWRSDHRNR